MISVCTGPVTYSGSVVCGRGTCEMGSSICLHWALSASQVGPHACLMRCPYPGAPPSAVKCMATAPPWPWSLQRPSSTTRNHLLALPAAEAAHWCSWDGSVALLSFLCTQGWLFCLKVHLEWGTDKVHVSFMMLGHCSWIIYPWKSCPIADSITFLSVLLLMLWVSLPDKLRKRLIKSSLSTWIVVVILLSVVIRKLNQVKETYSQPFLQLLLIYLHSHIFQRFELCLSGWVILRFVSVLSGVKLDWGKIWSLKNYFENVPFQLSSDTSAWGGSILHEGC